MLAAYALQSVGPFAESWKTWRTQYNEHVVITGARWTPTHLCTRSYSVYTLVTFRHQWTVRVLHVTTFCGRQCIDTCSCPGRRQVLLHSPSLPRYDANRHVAERKTRRRERVGVHARDIPTRAIPTALPHSTMVKSAATMVYITALPGTRHCHDGIIIRHYRNGTMSPASTKSRSFQRRCELSERKACD